MSVIGSDPISDIVAAIQKHKNEGGDYPTRIYFTKEAYEQFQSHPQTTNRVKYHVRVPLERDTISALISPPGVKMEVVTTEEGAGVNGWWLDS